MKSYKFRGWAGEEMIYKINSISLINGELKSNLYKLMQYTGLKDKNGKEIYEGDIVEHKYWVMSGMMFEDETKKIVNEDGSTTNILLPPPIFDTRLTITNKPLFETVDILKIKIPSFFYELEKIREGCCYSSYKKTAKYLEIIGNIYENPELIEEIK